jgi:site-specific DNA recombinase
MAKADLARTGSTIRCAIYTRKSSDEGLEQEFNSLDAQREACEAYIVSQRHAGWIALSDMYDDGGLSGGTMERPALKRLLEDIQAGKVQIVVVYKVDRLTRSLADFAKIVDIFDAHNASFVSVTQQFNTTTSMGRLTLNMLLSFAQFEREIAGERIRDKIAASKAKGMWMGDNVPLGYDVRERKLVVSEAEASTVRMIFQRYAELGSVALLKAELERAGIVSKRREGADGGLSGGKPFSRGALYLMLQNWLYRGNVAHKEKIYPGQHEAIIEPELWQAVQDRLAAGRRERSMAGGAEAPSLLSGLIFDSDGARLSPTMPSRRASGIDTMSRRRLSLSVAPSIPKAGAFRRATSKGWCSTVCARSSRLVRKSVTPSRRSALTPRPNEPCLTARQSWRSAGPSLHHSSFANSCDPWSSRSRLARPKSWCGSIEPQSWRA